MVIINYSRIGRPLRPPCPSTAAARSVPLERNLANVVPRPPARPRPERCVLCTVYHCISVGTVFFFVRGMLRHARGTNSSLPSQAITAHRHPNHRATTKMTTSFGEMDGVLAQGPEHTSRMDAHSRRRRRSRRSLLNLGTGARHHDRAMRQRPRGPRDAAKVADQEHGDKQHHEIQPKVQAAVHWSRHRCGPGAARRVVKTLQKV